MRSYHVVRSAAACVVVLGVALAQERGHTELLQGTIVGLDGQPVAGAKLELHRRPGRGFTCLDLDYAHTSVRTQVLRTGKNGTFAAELPRGVPFDLVFDDGENAPIRRCAVYGGEEVRLSVVPSARAVFEVRDQSGAACAGGTVKAWDAALHRWVAGTIDAAGRWQSERLPPGPMTFDVVPATARRPEWRAVELAAGKTETLQFVVAAGNELRGRITDAISGAPLPGARLGEGWTMGRCSVADADGRYSLPGYGGAGYGEVRVTAPGYVPQRRSIKPGHDEPALDFELVRGGEIEGRVVDPAGKPLAGVYVAAVGGIFVGDGGETFDWVGATTGADGAFRLVGMRTDAAHGILMRAPGYAPLVGDRPAFGADRMLVLRTVAMRPGRYVGGVVVDADGTPVAGVEVTLAGANVDRAELFGPGTAANQADYYIARRGMRTDSRGRLHFADVPPGRYALSCVFGNGSMETVEVTVGDRDPEPLRIAR
jgi:protocatechuate 3,4-dioxygenase beta subunit